jgi:RimJ/RimL family protein N-acetyltransferase
MMTQERVTLRPVMKQDLALLSQWAWASGDDGTLTRSPEAWLKDYTFRSTDYVFIILDPERGDEPVGHLSIFSIDWAARRARLGRIYMDGERGRLLLGPALNRALVLAGKQLQMREIAIHVFEKDEDLIDAISEGDFLPPGAGFIPDERKDRPGDVCVVRIRLSRSGEE